jgi:hypothetical protein
VVPANLPQLPTLKLNSNDREDFAVSRVSGFAAIATDF